MDTENGDKITKLLNPIKKATFLFTIVIFFFCRKYLRDKDRGILAIKVSYIPLLSSAFFSKVAEPLVCTFYISGFRDGSANP